MQEIYNGLAILLKYDPDGGCAAQHDIIYAGGPSKIEVSPEDEAKLTELGWFVDSEYGCWAKFV